MGGFHEDEGGQIPAPPAHRASAALAGREFAPLAEESSGDESSREAWHPRLKRLHDYWKAIHKPAGLPGRQDFDPVAIADLLPNVWMLDVQREPFRLRYRLVGTSIACSAPGGLTGRWLDEVKPESRTIPGYFDRHRAVVETGMPSWRRGRSYSQTDATFASLENLFLPMARDGRDVDMILAATIYYRFDATQF
jgi:hypothetical protein